MRFFHDCRATDFLLLQNRNTVFPVHKLRARILMYYSYTPVLGNCSMVCSISCIHTLAGKITILEAPLNLLSDQKGRGILLILPPSKTITWPVINEAPSLER